MNRLCGLDTVLLAIFVAGACQGTVETASPGGSSGGTSPGTHPGDRVASGCQPVPTRLWKLTPAQYSRTVQAALGDSTANVGDALSDTLPAKPGFANADATLDVSVAHLDQLYQVARKLAVTVVSSPRLFPCQQDPKGITQACMRTFLQGFTARAFRRDNQVADPDLYTYLAFWTRQSATYPPLDAARMMVTSILLSPQFLFRTELGGDSAALPGNTVTLTPFEKASALSYFLTDGPPDDALYLAARQGHLETAGQIREQAKRLLASATSGAGVVRLLSEMYGTGRIATAVKSSELLPDWSPELGKDLAREAELLFEEALWRGDRKLSTVLGGDFSVVNSRVGSLYGIPGGSATEFRRVALPPNRAGLLTSGALMATFARGTDTAPVQRGKFIRTTVLCQTLPPPPNANDAKPIPPDGKRTQRERLVQHSAAACASCHRLMDPLGLALESYDSLGKYRTTDVGKAIDPSGVLEGVTPERAPYADAPALVRLLAKSPEAASCFAAKASEYAVGRPASEVGACFNGVTDSAKANAGDIIELMLAVASDPAFHTRRIPLEGEARP